MSLCHRFDCPAGISRQIYTEDAFPTYGPHALYARCTCGLTSEYRWKESFPPIPPAPVLNGQYSPDVKFSRVVLENYGLIEFNPHRFVMEWPRDPHPLLSALEGIPEESD